MLLGCDIYCWGCDICCWSCDICYGILWATTLQTKGRPASWGVQNEPQKWHTESVTIAPHESNGDVQSAIKSTGGMFRTMRADLESCYKRSLEGDHNCFPWLAMHVGGTIFRESRGTDGMAPYKRIRGTYFKRETIKFGECVWHLRPKSKGKAKGKIKMVKWNMVWNQRGIRRIYCGDTGGSVQSENC